MGLSVGIVGLPNVGKSTLFNALTKRQQAAAENYPFCTIEPNSAIVEVADARLEALAKIVSPQQIIRATVEFTDIAGLVKGASKGEGLGNKFLANIRECDAILHVVRCFENDDIIHVQEGGTSATRLSVTSSSTSSAICAGSLRCLNPMLQYLKLFVRVPKSLENFFE